MTIQVINTGTSPNSGNGDSIRTAFSKVNDNFAELATLATGTSFDLLAVPSSIVPATDQNYSLGSASDQWENLYLGPNGVTIDGNELTIDGSGNITVNGTPFQSGFASTSSLINGSVQVQLDPEGSLNFPPNGILQSYISSATTATIFLIDDIMLDSPVMIHTVGPHDLSNSDLVKITGIGTTVELNNKYHYVSVVNTTTVDLYEDAALSIPVDGTNYTPFLGLSDYETFTNTGTTGRSNIISQFLDVYPDIVNVRVNWYASGPGIDQPDPDTTNYTVVKQSGFLNYLVDGEVNKPIYLQRGNTYYLNVFAPPHPVYIQTTGAGYNPADVYSLGVTNQGTGDGTITFTVPLNAPDTLYYQCQHHAEMVGPIYISDGVGTSKVLAVNTQTTSSRILYQFILDNTWPLVNQGSYAFTGTFEGGGQLEFQDVEARLTVKSNEQTWIFNPTGVLTLPPGGDIQRNGLSVLNSLKGRTFVVTETEDGEKYVFNGQPDSPDIVLIRGLAYYFEANLPGHPFWIQSTPGAFDINSVLTNGIINNGVEVGTLTFTVPEDAADILYYACEYHPGMTGQFLVRNLGDELDLTKIHTDVTPDEQYTHDLGSTSTHWRNLYARTGFFGETPSWVAANPLSVFTADVDGYTQIQAQNLSTGTSASTDFVATADSGDDENDYINFGINGSNYVNEDWTVSGGRDGYLYVSGNNLTIGTDSSGTTVKIHIGGTLEENLVAIFDSTGLMPAADLTYDLGSTSSQWRSLYVGTSTIYLGGTALSVANGELTVDGNPIQGTTVGDSNIWVQTFESVDGAPTDIPAVALSVEYDSAGNVIALFTHYNNLTNSTYYSVGKYTTAGTKIWTARFSDDFNTDGWGLAVDNDTNTIYVAGETTPEVGYSVSTLTKLDAADGSIVWSKTYDFGFNSQSSVVDVASDGNPVMVGYADNGNDYYVTTTKVSALDGSITWTRSLNGQGDEEAVGMAVGPDGEVVVIGYMDNIEYEGPINTILTLSASPASDPDWTVNQSITVGGVSFDVSFTDGVPTFSNIVDLDGNHTVGDTISNIPGISIGSGSTMLTVTVGTTTQENLDDRMLVVKYDSVGAIQWQKAILFDEGFNCSGADADIDSLGNIYVTGSYRYSFEGGTTSALSILKLDGNGAKQWSRRVQGNCETFGISVVVGADDKLYLSGMTGVNAGPEFIWVAAKYDFNGLVEWQRLIDNTTGWSFTGGIFFSNGGGSNIAVKQDYVVLAGGFGDLINNGIPQATVVQVAAAGDVFSVGDWDFKAASFSGVLDGTASDITVVNAGKTDTDNSSNVTTGTVTLATEVSNFLLGTLYTVAVGNDRLVNSGSELVLSSTGTVTLPAGGTITEGVVTSNPTIQLTPASPDVASQKLVIKGGGNYNFTDNGININYYVNTAIVGDNLTFYVYSDTYADQTLYWWIYPTGANLATPSSGTVELTGSSGTITLTLDSDDYEFTVRVSPEADNYDPANVGVESGVINASAPTFDSPHHLHLTTGDLSETSIFLGTDNHNVRTTVDGGIQVTTESTVPLVPPTTIVISGADVVAVNLTYTRDLIQATPTWVSPENNPATDPYIVFVEGEYGIIAPDYDPVTPIYVNTGTINIPLAQWNINPPYGSVAPTGVYTYPTPDVYEWKFGPDGTTTFPTLTVPISDNATPSGTGQTLKFSDTSQQAIIYGPESTSNNNDADRIIIQGAPGYDGTGGEGGDVYVWAGPGGSLNGQGGDIKVRAGQGILGGSGGYLNFQAGDSGTGEGGYINIESGDTGTYGNGGDITIQARSGGRIVFRTFNSEGNSRDLELNNAGTTTLPGAVVKSTVTTPATSGIPSSFSLSTSTNTNLTTGTYTNILVGFSGKNITLDVVVDGSYNISLQNFRNVSPATFIIGDSAVLGGDVIGGTTPTDDLTITVAELVPVAIDLTKSINKLADGNYSLANGVEGQIMYVVRQNGSTAANISVVVANARWDGSVYSDQLVIPFQIPFTDMVTIIFTDGAWQASNGGGD